MLRASDGSPVTGKAPTGGAGLIAVSDDGSSIAFEVPSSSPKEDNTMYVVDSAGTYAALSSFDGVSTGSDNLLAAFTRESQVCLAPMDRVSLDHYWVDCVAGAVPVPNGSGYVNPGALSLDDRYLAFTSDATNLLASPISGGVHVYLRDQNGGALQLLDRTLSGAPGSCVDPFECGQPETSIISEDGGTVAFVSSETDLVAGDSNNSADVFISRRGSNSVVEVSVGPNGESAFDSTLTAIRGNGRYVVFGTEAPNLVTTDTNGKPDVFVRDTLRNSTELVSVGLDGNSASGASDSGSISSDGRYVVFLSSASDLVAGSTTGASYVFVRDLLQRATYAIAAPADDTVTGALISGDGRSVVYLVDPSGDTSGAQTTLMQAAIQP